MTDSKSAPWSSPENTTPQLRQRHEVDAFLAKMRGASTQPAATGGRLIFALDATASRQPTWDTACQLQAEMFREATAIGSLSVQLVYYRGLSECRASQWVSQPEHLSGLMEQIDCRMGHTQLGKILAHARRETELLKVQALVFVGDAHGGEPRRAQPRRRRARAPRRAGLHVPRRPRSKGRAASSARSRA